MSTPLENLMVGILRNTNQLAQHEFSNRNQDVTNHLSNLPTSQILQREAQPLETRLFTISSGEAQARFHADLIKEMQDIRHATSKKDADRLLSLASALNKISNSAAVQERINQMKQQHEESQLDKDYSLSSAKDYEMTMHEEKKTIQGLQHNNKTLVERELQITQEETKVAAVESKINAQLNKVEYAKSLVKEKRRLLERTEQERQVNTQSKKKTRNTNDSHSQSDLLNVKKSRAQLKKVEQLKKTIVIEKSRLDSTSSPSTIQLSSPFISTSSSLSSSSSSPFISTSHSAQAISDLLQHWKTNKDGPDYQKNGASGEEIISTTDLAIQALQEAMICFDRRQELEDQLEKMNHFRQQIVTKTDQEIQDVIDKTKGGDQEILMAMTLVILHQHNGRILFEDLKNKITDYATHLGLGSSLGSGVIYSWVGKEVFSIDRSQADSFVQSNWK